MSLFDTTTMWPNPATIGLYAPVGDVLDDVPRAEFREECSRLAQVIAECPECQTLVKHSH